MVTQGAFVIIRNEKNRILLVRRKDFPIWDLPGGRVEQGEKPRDCAMREAYEETGYKVTIEKKIGIYKRPKVNDTQYIYLAKIIGGKAIKEGDETSKLQFFHWSLLPLLMVPNRKEQIKDYKKGKTNISKTLKDRSILYVVQKLKKRK